MRTSQRSGVPHDVRMARRGRRGEGSVYWSKTDRRWVARWPLGVIDGRRRAKRVKCRTERQANAELERLRRAYGAGVSPTTGTLDEYLADWLETPRDIEPSTLRSYREHVNNHISPLLGGIPVVQLQPADVDRLIRDRLRFQRNGKYLSPTTVGRIVTTLRIALNRAVRRGALPVNVAALVDLPRPTRYTVPAMSDPEADRILDAVEGHWLEPVIRLLFGSAIRLGEAVSLNQGDVFPEQAFVRLRKSKTTIRAVPISEDAIAGIAQALAVAPRRGPDEPLFFGVRTGERLTGASVSHAFPKLLVDAGLPRVTPHGLRHGAATLMVAKGVHMRIVAEQLGHRNPAITARVYAHVIPEVQRAAVDALPRRRAR
jgi:integrase